MHFDYSRNWYPGRHITIWENSHKRSGVLIKRPSFGLCGVELTSALGGLFGISEYRPNPLPYPIFTTCLKQHKQWRSQIQGGPLKPHSPGHLQKLIKCPIPPPISLISLSTKFPPITLSPVKWLSTTVLLWFFKSIFVALKLYRKIRGKLFFLSVLKISDLNINNIRDWKKVCRRWQNLKNE